MFKNYVETVGATTLKMSGDNINQTQRNELKGATVQALHDLLKANGVEVALTSKGVAMVLDTATNRKFIVEIDAVVKNAKYDLAQEVADYQDILNERAERERIRLEKREWALAERQLKIDLAKKEKEKESE